MATRDVLRVFNIMVVDVLPGALQRTGHLLAGRAIPATHATLIKPLAGANDAITSSFDTLTLDANRGGIWAAGSAVSHLEQQRTHRTLELCLEKTVM